jgi:penicillin-binding protein 1C
MTAPITPAPFGRRGSRAGRLQYVAAAIASAVALSALATAWYVTALGPAPTGNGIAYSKLVLDRENRLLRAYATPEGYWRIPVAVTDVDPRFLRLLFAYEDKRFLSHYGIDPLAMLRATYQFLGKGRIVSGASTLSMQVARLLEPRPERSLLAKLRQLARAIELERQLSKDEIVALYLNLAPYGGNLEGIRAASLAYFGREPRRLTLGEAALLVALPQAPEVRRPDRASAAARLARDRVLERAAAAGAIPRDEAERAKEEPVPKARLPMPMLAPHAADQAIAALPDQPVYRLTIDAFLQRNLEHLARARARMLGPGVSVAIVAIDNASGNIVARVGSPDYFDEVRAGQVDMTQAVRSPGSALKPFIYGLGFEDGLVHPETLIDDRPARYGNYAPENFDLTFQGTVTVRHALQLSLNVPAVAVFDKVGASRLAARLANAGAPLQLPKGDVPSLAMALGGVGIKLTELTTLYAGLARLGTTVVPTERVGRGDGTPLRLMDPVAAWYVGNVLIGAPPPENGVRGRIAFKTGTSYGYRDAWSIGFDGKHTIGVWVGRADGAPVPGMLGRTAAAPILFDAFARAGRIMPLPPPPKGAIFAPTAKLPPTLVRFRPGGLVGGETPLRIVFPQNGVRLEVGAGPGGKLDPVGVKVLGGRAPLTVLANGLPVATGRGGRTLFFDPDGPGFVRLTVMDATGAADSVVVRIQ